MKKNLFLLASLVVIISMAYSCKKVSGQFIVPPSPSITILSPKGGEVYTAGQYFDVTWKNNNISSGTAISLILIKNINGIDSNIGYLNPEHENGFIKGTTINDGEEKFLIPSDFGTPNVLKGTTFKVMLQVQYPNIGGANPAVIIGESQSYFTILQAPWRDGCTSTVGYSVTTGQPCAIP